MEMENSSVLFLNSAIHLPTVIFMMICSYVFGSGFVKRVNFNYTNTVSVIRGTFKYVCLLLANLTYMMGIGSLFWSIIICIIRL